MKHSNRWVCAVVGVLVLLLAGLVYAWTVLQAPIAAGFPQWSKGQLSLTFTITMAAFCIGGFLGGRLQSRLSCRSLLWLAAGLFLLGFFLASRAEGLALLYVGFGVLAGMASGIAYNAVMSSVSLWFPDRPGLISGVLLMGFGMSSFLVGKVYTALTPSDGGDGWRSSFLLLGVLLCVVLLAAGLLIARPGSDWTPPASAGSRASESYASLSTSAMLRQGSFWKYLVWATFLTAAGLAIISQGTPMALEVCPELSMGAVATLVGLLSVTNGLGRILFGGMYDLLGRRTAMLCGGGVFLLAMALLLVALRSHSQLLLGLAYLLTGLGYGSVMPTNSAFVGQFYGREHYPSNFSVVNMNILVASFGSTAAGAVYDATQSYQAIILVVMALLALGMAVGCTIRQPEKGKA